MIVLCKGFIRFMKREEGIYEKYIKRLLDIVFVLMVVLLFWWLFIIIAIIVKFNMGSPVIFKQPRVGKNEKIFNMYKFRSMTEACDENGNLLPDEERLTRFGKVMRASSMDEIPEIINILRGDMSIVGPRPLLVRYLDRYTPEQHRRHEVKPGLTGLATSRVRNSAGWEKKFELDIEYVDNISFWLDVKIFFWTIKIVLKREGINEEGYATNSEFMGDIQE